MTEDKKIQIKIEGRGQINMNTDDRIQKRKTFMFW